LLSRRNAPRQIPSEKRVQARRPTAGLSGTGAIIADDVEDDEDNDERIGAGECAGDLALRAFVADADATLFPRGEGVEEDLLPFGGDGVRSRA